MIVNFEDLPSIREDHSADSVVFMGGCYDIVHEGHALGLSHCKTMGDLLVVGVSSDERVRQRKGPARPIRSEMSRLMLVNALKPVDYAFLMPMPNDDLPTIQVIRQLRPDIFMDHRENWERWTDTMAQIEALGTQIIFNESPVLDSTTNIIAKVLKSHR